MLLASWVAWSATPWRSKLTEPICRKMTGKHAHQGCTQSSYSVPLSYFMSDTFMHAGGHNADSKAHVVAVKVAGAASG